MNKDGNLIKIEALPALKDNYIWMIIDFGNNTALIVDPGEAIPVEQYLGKRKLKPLAILITHHHWDHSNGAASLKSIYDIPVYCSEKDKIDPADFLLNENDKVIIPDFPIQYRVMDIAAHTKGHIAFYGAGALFCGDTLFSAGCGRLFEGTAEDMFKALKKIASLPDDTKIYCAHEYTLNNLRFAEIFEPGNTAITERIKQVTALRKNNEASLPSILSIEKETNPFLRCDSPVIKKQVESHFKRQLDTPLEVFRWLRKWKDSF